VMTHGQTDRQTQTDFIICPIAICYSYGADKNVLQIWKKVDKILIKSLYLNGYTTVRLTEDESPEKSWSKHGVNKQLKKLQNTGTVDRH